MRSHRRLRTSERELASAKTTFRMYQDLLASSLASREQMEEKQKDVLEQQVTSVEGVRSVYRESMVHGAPPARGDVDFLCSRIEKAESGFAKLFRLN